MGSVLFDSILGRFRKKNAVLLGDLPLHTHPISEVVSLQSELDDKYDASNPDGFISNITGINAGGDLSGTFPSPAVLNSAVLAKVLTGLNISGSSIAAADNLLQAFGKLQSQLNGILGGAIYISTWAPSTNTPTLANGTGTKGHYYVATDDGSVDFGAGAISFNTGDWAIHNGTIYEKVDNTDAVSSVNGYLGAVNLTSADITEVTNLYFTTARVLSTALAGLDTTAGTVTSADSVLQAIGKLVGNIAAISANPTVTEVVGTSLAQTSSASAVLLTGMTLTPGAGNYLAIFSCYGEPSAVAGASITVGLRVNDVAILGTTRVLENNTLITSGAQNGSIAINAKITVGAGQAVEIKWSSSSATASISHRVLSLIRIV